MKKNFGFTLAEVLITLGIIGIIAAMTIPTLLNNIETERFRSALKKTYSSISQVHLYIQSENRMPFSTTQEYAAAFLENVKTTKSCITPEPGCWASSYYKPSGTLSSLINDGTLVYTLVDGSFIAFGTSCSVDPGQPPSIYSGGQDRKGYMYVDLNGLAKPNKWGSDIFYMEYTGNKIIPGGLPGSFSADPATYCSRTAIAVSNGIGCTYLALQGISY